MSWTLQAGTKSSLESAAADCQTAVASLATAVASYKSALATATAEIQSQDAEHVGDAGSLIGWPRVIICIRGAMVSNGLAAMLSGDPGDKGFGKPTCADIHQTISDLLTGR